jgi:hypothetical protein
MHPHSSPGSPSPGPESNNDSGMDMWYVALKPMQQQQETIMLGSLEEDEDKEEEPNNIKRVCHYFNYVLIVTYLHFNYVLIIDIHMQIQMLEERVKEL